MNKIVLPIVIALVAISFTIGLGINIAVPTSPTVSGGAYEHGLVTVRVQRCLKLDANNNCLSYGEQEVVGHGTNLITNGGLAKIQNATNGTVVYLNLTNLTVGGNTSAIGVTDTVLANIQSVASGLGPAPATYTIVGICNQSLNYQWTAAAVSVVNTTGIYNFSNNIAGGLFAEAGWTPTTTLQIGDKLSSVSSF